MFNLLTLKNIMELLNKLYSIHSMSGQEGAMRKFIKKYVKDNIPGAVCRQDNGNLYIVKGEAETYPCVVAHLDQVQTKHSPDFKVFRHDNVLFGYSAKSGRQEGLGADDKNGIWVALHCLDHFDVLKVALFKEEEIGCGGSRVADMGFFKDCRFAIQADRRNGGDLITDICGSICSKEFLADIMPFAEKRGYKETDGLMTDVETLSDNGLGVSAINFSCGYYNPHTDAEYTKADELLNCLGLAFDIIENCTKVYPFEREKWPVYTGKGWGRYFDDWDGYDYSGKSSSAGYDADKDMPKNVFVPNFKDYPTAQDAVWSFLESNLYNVIDPENLWDVAWDLWDYVSSDCDTYGMDFDAYWEIAQDACVALYDDMAYWREAK